jgi:hypothetical protein
VRDVFGRRRRDYAGTGIPGRLYLDEGWAVEEAIAGAADYLAFTAINEEAAVDFGLRGRSEADISRIVCFIEARATRPNDIDAGRYSSGERDREQDLEAARRIRAAFERSEGRPLRWAPPPNPAT